MAFSKWFSGLRLRLLISTMVPVLAFATILSIGGWSITELGHLLNVSYGTLTPKQL